MESRGKGMEGPGVPKEVEQRGRNRKAACLVLAVLILLAGGAGFYFLPGAQAVPGLVRGSGMIEGAGVLVSSQLPGQVMEMPVKEGQRVAKGDLLARLESAELEAKVQQAQAQLEIAIRQVEQAGGAGVSGGGSGAQKGCHLRPYRGNGGEEAGATG